jgi:tRNA1Val (adenine37-N6)-methyltransferase
VAEVAVTSDTLFGGRVTLTQPAKKTGYRVNVDALLLASFAAATGRKSRAVVDLGAGVGAVGLALLHLDAAAHVTMVELDESLCDLAEENARANGWSRVVHVVRDDVGNVTGVAADLIVCNPPYFAPGRGRAPAARVLRARSGSLEPFVDAARRLSGRRARSCFVYPATEATTLLTCLRARGLEPKRLRAVHSKSTSPARVVLVEACPGKAGGLIVEPPLVEVDARGRPSDALRAIVDA